MLCRAYSASQAFNSVLHRRNLHSIPENVPDGEDTDMIECEICLGWYHRTCLNLSSEEFETLSKPQCLWMCDFKGCAEAFDVFSDSD